MAEAVIGIGIDIIEVIRLRKLIEKWGDSFSCWVFTKKELSSVHAKVNKYQHLAGIFAVKEAIFKATGGSGIGFKDMEIFNDKTDKPYCKFRNNKAQNITINVSISYVKNYVIANAIATKKTRLSQSIQ